MNELSDAQIELLKANIPAGSRIHLIRMGDDPRPIEPGTLGTVDRVDDIGTIHCTFNNGRRLGIIPGEDEYEILPKEQTKTKAEER